MKKEKQRINFKDEFESCYMRHQYLRQAKYSPTEDDMKPYSKIVYKTSLNTFNTYKNLFYMVGLTEEDVINNGQIQLVSFLGLFALERNQEKMRSFKKLFKGLNSIKCTQEDILNKNKANFTCFLKQRMQDMVRVCKQKARNIKGALAEEYVVYIGKKRPPNDIEDLLTNHQKYGYHPLGEAAFKTIKKRMSNKQEGPVYLDRDVWYVCVPIRKKMLNLTDFSCNNLDPFDNLFNKTPEEFLDIVETENNFEKNKLKFEKSSEIQKAKLISLFLENNKENPDFEEEIKIAKRYLEKLSGNRI